MKVIFFALAIQLLCSLQILSQGVGIGTINPNGELHIHDLNNDGSVVSRLTTANSEVLFGFNPSNQGILGTSSNHDLRIRTAGINRFVIKNDGKIGIGTTFPSEKLEVNGNVKLSNGNLDVNNGNGITITTAADKITLTAGNSIITINENGAIDISAPTGDINLSGLNINITASGSLDINAANIDISAIGVIDVNALPILLNADVTSPGAARRTDSVNGNCPVAGGQLQAGMIVGSSNSVRIGN